MIYSCLATAFALFGATHGAENVNTGTGSRCAHYIRTGSIELLPVNECYTENSNEAEICQSSSSSCAFSEQQNMMWECKATSNGTEACLVRMGANCNGPIYETGECYPCNGEQDQCECSVGAQGVTDCQYYEETSYDYGFGISTGWYCNKKQTKLKRTVVNMCIQGTSGNPQGGSAFTYKYSCGGYDSRSQNDQDYADDYEYFSTADCSGSDANPPTGVPTAMTSAPSEAPTETGATGSDGIAWCMETTCDGVAGPRADGVDRKSVVVAIAFSVFASLMA